MIAFVCFLKQRFADGCTEEVGQTAPVVYRSRVTQMVTKPGLTSQYHVDETSSCLVVHTESYMVRKCKQSILSHFTTHVPLAASRRLIFPRCKAAGRPLVLSRKGFRQEQAIKYRVSVVQVVPLSFRTPENPSRTRLTDAMCAGLCNTIALVFSSQT
ncbi:hypothetical protein E6O75_ATG09085 [Venturia nashicola]|uniref:Uncharacterized protein n=1 Tax=Venturia nashicola TaxID=86259 RepID=A0A4Z1NS73_9PEZI|nr:hypothetical protein E6O75_ATG09085 [Venturia nashicola]